MRRGQAAIEFLILGGFMLLVFVTFFVVVQERAVLKQQQALQNELFGVANVVSQEVSMANRVRAGYERVFELPLLINNEPYTVSLHPAEGPSEMVISSGEYEYVVFLPVNLSGESEIRPGHNKILKEENISVVPTAEIACETAADCGEPAACTQFVCENPGTPRARCSTVPAEEGEPCADDGLSCTDDVCRASSCVHEDTCTSPERCIDDGSGGSCQLVCQQDETEYRWYAGVRGTNGFYGQTGTDWDETGGLSREENGQRAICCDSQTTCVGGPPGNPRCQNAGTPNFGRWLCENTGEGAEWFRCSNSRDGETLPGGYCCSKYSSDPPGGRTAGEYGFGPADSAYKTESCTDGSDNDCDGLTDCADPDCTWQPACSLCGQDECEIGGQCYDDGQTNPANSCQVCDPGETRTAWSDRPDGASCDDGYSCTSGEVCAAGVCQQGQIDSRKCLIDGSCYDRFEANPDNVCYACKDWITNTRWSHNNGASCEDGEFCTTGDTCFSGQCGSGTNDPCSDPTPACKEDTDECVQCIESSDCPDTTYWCGYQHWWNGDEWQYRSVIKTRSYRCLTDNTCDDRVYVYRSCSGWVSWEEAQTHCQDDGDLHTVPECV